MATAEQYAKWIVENQDKKGTPEFETVAKAYQLVRGDPNAKYRAMQTTPEVDPTKDMSFGQTAAAGLGKMMVDTIRGGKQLMGIGNKESLQKTIDEEKALTRPLMNTWGGNVGNIGGQVGLALLPGGVASLAGRSLAMPGLAAAGGAMMAPPFTLGGAAIGAGMGAAQGAIQPVATGESRMANMALPAIGGAAVPLVGMGVGAVKGAIEPLYAGGRDRIIGRALRSAAGPNADTAAQKLLMAQTLVPGSQPTAAEVAESGGIAAMQRAASAVDPEAYATRAAQQNAARVSALQGMAGTSGARQSAEASRDVVANQLYKSAREAGLDKGMADALKPQIKNLMERMPQGVIEKAKELARLNGERLDKAGSLNGLHWMKLAVDDMLSSAKQTGVGDQTKRALTVFKGDLLTIIDELSPAYAKARTTFQQMSKPVNQMDIAQELADRSINPLSGIMQPQAFARNLTDDLAARATGFSGSTLGNTMTPQQLGLLGNIKTDLARSVAARDMGRGAGSDTVQKLAMTNLMQQSGLPTGLLNLPGLGRAGNWAYAQTDELMKQRLAEALLDPKQTAILMQAAKTNPQLRRAIDEARRIAAPGILGGTLTLNTQQQ